MVFKDYEREVLEELLDNPDYGFTVKELADSVSGSYNSVKNFLEKLNDFGIVRFTSKGNYRIVEYDVENDYHEVLKSIFTVEKSERMRAAEDYAEEIYEMNREEIVSVVVFGSVARGTADKGSDVDILIITENKEDVDRIKSEAIKLRDRKSFSKVVPVTESLEEFRDAIAHESRFEKNVYRDGKVLAGESLSAEVEGFVK